MAYNDDSMKQMENELKDKRVIIDNLENDIIASNNVNRNQEKALNGLNKEGPNDFYLEKVKKMLVKNKMELKKSREEMLKEDKRVKDHQQKIYKLKEKVQNYEKLVKVTKRRVQTDTESQSDLREKIDRLNQEINEIEEAESHELNQKKNILSSIQAKRSDAAHKVKLTMLKLKEKDQEGKLNDLKAKELKRAVPNKAKLKPLKRNQSQSERSSEQLDTKVSL